MGTVIITAFYAGILAIILVVLSVRVVVARVRRASSNEPRAGGEDELLPVIRGQGNFIEYVPLAVVLMGFLEFTGSSTNLIHGLGIALVVARVLHPFGLRLEPGPTVLRAGGAVVTWIVLLIAAITAIQGFLSANPT
jgi:uncharacterized membrane protein YecN with MAPEG domain